ncbi:rho GDP-dissociation inhibitor 1-like [Humulus lupulus]|uniref:rho GDP-dissociation inhibitor 1-like n=1 Tax=Humulus lupulus TaxID=3486 RepID=UPI002B40B0DA|nr:rho GDP-dissociation inhibitor 1-like [Humulus lupulus]
MVKSTKDMLNSSFDMKDMRLADVILGINITRMPVELSLSQPRYVDKILDKFGKNDSGVSRTPIDISHHLSKNKGDSVSKAEYARVIGQREPEVKFHSIGIIFDDFGEIITSLPVNENERNNVLFTLKEGSHYWLKLTFSVLHNIVSGLIYSNTVWK